MGSHVFRIGWPRVFKPLAGAMSLSGVAAGLVNDHPLALAAGSLAVTGSAATLTASGGGSTPDPEELGLATGQNPDGTAYDLLGVPSMDVGDSYADPTTGVTIYRGTDATYPDQYGHMTIYSMGGPYMSMPYTDGDDTMYHVIVAEPDQNGVAFVFDFNYTQGSCGNYRSIPGGVNVNHCFSYSSPHIVYYVSGDNIQRYDVENDQLANTGNFPSADLLQGGSGGHWLGNDKNDRWFICQNQTYNGVWDADTPAVQAWGSDRDEPYIDKDGLWLYNPRVSTEVWTGRTDDVGSGWTQITGVNEFEMIHGCVGLGGRWMGESNYSGNSWLWVYNPNTNGRTNLGTDGEIAGSGGNTHNACQWVGAGVGSAGAQWFLHTQYGGGGGLVRDAIAFVKSDDTGAANVRLLCHHYGTTSTYNKLAKSTLSPDGKLVAFTSDMNGESRYDVFLAKVPLS